MNELLAPALLSLPAVAATGLLVYNDRRQRQTIRLLAERAHQSAKTIERFANLLNERREVRAQQMQSAVTETRPTAPPPAADHNPRESAIAADPTPAPPRRGRPPGRRGRKFTHVLTLPDSPQDATVARKLRALRRHSMIIVWKTFFEHVDCDKARVIMGYPPGECPSKDSNVQIYRSYWGGQICYWANDSRKGQVFIFTQDPA